MSRTASSPGRHTSSGSTVDHMPNLMDSESDHLLAKSAQSRRSTSLPRCFKRAYTADRVCAYPRCSTSLGYARVQQNRSTQTGDLIPFLSAFRRSIDPSMERRTNEF